MSTRRVGRVLVLAAVLGMACGCGARSQLRPGGSSQGTGGSAGSGGGDAAAGGTGGSGAGGSGAGVPDAGAAIFGYIGLAHVIERDGYEWEQLTLYGAFYGEPYDPEIDRPDYVETRLTPDGVSCDIYYQSGMMGEEPPPPPDQVDGGRITAWAGWDSSDSLEITFDGELYTVDSRPNPEAGMPAWLVEDAIAVTFEGHGSSLVGAFSAEATLAATPVIVAPPPGQQQIPPGPDGNFLIAWQPTPAGETIVRLEFNLDWDNSAFVCHPPAGTTQLLLPSDWINEWTWGTGELSLVSRHEMNVSVAEATITIRTSRFPRRAVSFEIEW